MSDRGMKKWAPYRSLPEKDIVDAKMKKLKNKIEKPLISNEVAEEINFLLLNHENNELIFIVFKDEKKIQINGFIKKIDVINRVVILTDKTKIPLSIILDIKKSK